MGLFDHFPYTNVHELNLDWVLTVMKALEAEWEAFTAGNSLTFADPLQHDISKTYAKNTIVLDDNGNAYVSLQAVPVGVGLGDQDYWLMVFDYEAFIEKVNKNFTARYYRDQYRATAPMVIGDWLTVDDVLCKASAPIAADDVLEVGVNIEHFTLEDFIKAFMTSANQMIQQYKNDIDASELAYRQQLANDIAATTASLQAQLDAAISGATADSEVINARVGEDGYTYPTLGDAIRTQFEHSYSVINKLTKNKIIPITDYESYVDLSGSTADVNNPASSAIFNCSIITCNAGDVFTIMAKGGNAPRAYGFVAANGDVLEAAAAGADLTNVEVVAPPDSAYLVINTRVDAGFKPSFLNQRLFKGVEYTDIAMYNVLSDSDDFVKNERYLDTYDEVVVSGIRILSCYLKRTTPYKLICNAGYQCRIIAFDSDLNFINQTTFQTEQGSDTVTADNYYRIMVAKTDPTDPIDISDFNSAFASGLNFFHPVTPVKQIKADIKELESIGCNLEEITFDDSFYYIPTDGDTVDIANPVAYVGSGAGYKYAVVSCSAGDKFIISGRGGAVPRLWCFIDSSGNVIEVSPENSIIRDVIITAPANAANLVLNVYQENTYKNYKILQPTNAFSQYRLNKNLTGLHDMCWEYQNWVYPQCIAYNHYRNQLYFGFLTGDTPKNYTGIAAVDLDTQEIRKTILKQNPDKDDHNLAAIKVLSNGKILAAYTGGHNTDHRVYIRISTEVESIDNFDYITSIIFDGYTSYVQIFEYNDTLYLFTRERNSDSDWEWTVVESDDLGYTWHNKRVIIEADTQYYMQLTETNTDGVLLLLCYSNPSYEDTDIRASYLHLDTMEIYQADNATKIADAPVDFHNIPIVVSPATGKKLRLYNGIKEDPTDVRFLFCEFTNTDGVNDGIYKVYDNGTVTDIVAAGRALWIPKAQLGIAWINDTKIVVARGSSGDDLLEIYDYDTATHTVTYNSLIASTNRPNGVRIARPMVAQDGSALVYWKGYFDPDSYTNFFTDGRIEILS